MCTYAADIVVHNDTKFYGTGYIKSSPCSSWLGDKGTAKPHQSLSISTSVIKQFCGSSDCTAFIFANKSCDKKPVAKALVNAKDGVIKAEAIDTDHFVASGAGYDVTLREKNPPIVKDWLESLFD